MPAPTPFDTIYSPFSAGPLPAFSVDPDDGELISVPFNPTYMPYVVGAIKSLVQPALYVGVPDIQLQLNRANLLLSMFNNPSAYQRPFYDDDEQMDDSTLPAAPWYEDVSDWIITLFLAVTVTPGAAIVYKTTIPRLRLAFRTGNIGTIVRVLIDDIEVWTGNTYSASEGMLETVIDVPASPGLRMSLLPGEHILKVVHAGEQGQRLEVIRGDLRPTVQTKLRMSALCGVLQVSYDNGATWNDLVDVNQCAANAANAAIDSALNNQLVAAPSQQPAGGTIPAAECKTYRITLNGNSRWMSPVPVQAGYSVTVSDARGAWSGDNAILSIWACVDGKQFSIGACGSPLPGIPGDPMPGLSHMRLIGYCNTVYMDMYNQTYIVPNGTPPSSFFLQCNDSDIANNQGSVTLTVTICNYSSWCYKFTGSELGAWIKSAGGSDGQGYGHFDGAKWVTTCNHYGSAYEAILIHKDFGMTAALTRINIKRQTLIAYNSLGMRIQALGLSDDGLGTESNFVGSWNLATLELNFCPGYNSTPPYDCPGAQGEITEITLYGTGVCPFGVPNC